jgi:serine/threonine-protein kinase
VPINSPEAGPLADALKGQYRIDEEIGRGGMGVVFLARDLKLDRAVAIKTLPAHLAREAGVRERFLREARTAAALSHPNIVPIYRADEANELVFFVMGYIEGASLAHRIREAPLSPFHAVSVLKDVAAALGYAHGRGVVHRDIKAENILLDRAEDRAMVTDFGIARLAESAPMTATGQVLGTVHYMSPEQVSGEPLDGRSDLYALGVLGFFMLSGRFPFESDVPSAVLVAHVTRNAPRLHDHARQVHPALAAIIDRLLEKRPDARPATAHDLVTALDRLPPGALEERPPDDERVLSSDDAKAVWERAALLQQMTGQIAPPVETRRSAPERASEPLTSGYRMEDVLAAAQEVGIDRKYVDRAVAERTPHPVAALPDGVVREGAMMREKPGFWVGSRTRLEYEAIVDGEIHADEFEELVDELRRSFGEFGTASTVGRTVTFTTGQSAPADSYPRRLQVTISSRNGRTTIRGFEDIRQMANGVVGGVSGGVGGGFGGAMAGAVMGATQNPLFAVPTLLGIAGLAFGLSRFGIRRYSDRKARELRAAVERLAVRVRELVDQGRLPEPPSRPRLPR